MKSLACRYRPQEFSDVCEQQSIITILENQIKNKSFNNCFLFSGHSGCGKTTVARIFANKINGGQGRPIEFDAASHGSAEDIRALIDDSYDRALDSEYKVYIIDECQSIGNGAGSVSNKGWQALLKVIEEPPKYTIFIFCTTDPQKIPPTILNRLVRFNFSKISNKAINDRLNFICEKEGFTNYKESCEFISRISGGGMRDAISNLEKCSLFSHDININNCKEVLGYYNNQAYFHLLNSIIDKNENNLVSDFTYIKNNTCSLKNFINDFISFCLNVSKYNIFKSVDYTNFTESDISELDYACNIEESRKFYNYLLDSLLEIKFRLVNDSNPDDTILIMLLKIARRA